MKHRNGIGKKTGYGLRETRPAINAIAFLAVFVPESLTITTAVSSSSRVHGDAHAFYLLYTNPMPTIMVNSKHIIVFPIAHTSEVYV